MLDKLILYLLNHSFYLKFNDIAQFIFHYLKTFHDNYLLFSNFGLFFYVNFEFNIFILFLIFPHMINYFHIFQEILINFDH